VSAAGGKAVSIDSAVDIVDAAAVDDLVAVNCDDDDDVLDGDPGGTEVASRARFLLARRRGPTLRGILISARSAAAV